MLSGRGTCPACAKPGAKYPAPQKKETKQKRDYLWGGSGQEEHTQRKVKTVVRALKKGRV